MSWAKFSDSTPHSLKLRRAGTDASMLWFSAVCWCNEHLTDGAIPRDLIVDVWRPLGEAFDYETAVAKCVEHGLILDHGDEYEIHDFLEFNMSANEVKKRRKSAAKRASKSRKARASAQKETGNGQGQRAAHVQRTSRVSHSARALPDNHACAPPSRPVPSRSRPVRTNTGCFFA